MISTHMSPLGAALWSDPSVSSTVLMLSSIIAFHNSTPSLGSKYIYMSSSGMDVVVLLRALSMHCKYTYLFGNRCLGIPRSWPSKYLIGVAGKRPEDIIRQVAQQLDIISCDESWKPETKTVVLVHAEFGPSGVKETAKTIIRLLWNKVMYNTVVLIVDKFWTNGTTFIADPFDKENECGRNLKVVTEHDSRTGRRIFYQFTNSLRKYPGCTITVTARNTPPFSDFTPQEAWTGIDIELAKAMSSKLDLNMVLIKRPSAEWKSSVKTVHQYYHNLSRNEIDLAVGGCAVGYLHYHKVQYLRSHDAQYISIFVTDGVLSQWRSLYVMFPLDVWLWIAASLMSCVLVVHIHVVYFKRVLKQKVEMSFLHVIGIVLERPVRLPSRKLRILIISFMVPFFGLSSMYTTYIQSMTIHPPIHNVICDLCELIDKKVPVLASNSTIELYIPPDKRTLYNLVSMVDTESAAELLDKNKSLAVLEKDIHMEYIIAQNGYAFRKLSYQMYMMNIAGVVPKGSLYHRGFNRLVESFLEHGIYLKWKRDEEWVARKKNRNKTKNDNKKREVSPPKPLKVMDVMSAFIVLMFGTVLSAISFIIEHIVHKFTKTNKK